MYIIVIMHSYVFISAEDKSKEILVLFEDKITFLCSEFTARAADYVSFVNISLNRQKQVIIGVYT